MSEQQEMINDQEMVNEEDVVEEVVNEQERIIKFQIFRYNPQKKGDKPRMVTYEIKEAPGMTVFIALNEIREKTGSVPAV